jgi:hypothetical protein
MIKRKRLKHLEIDQGDLRAMITNNNEDPGEAYQSDPVG